MDDAAIDSARCIDAYEIQMLNRAAVYDQSAGFCLPCAIELE